VNLNIHSILWKSKANGPGIRSVVWFQGCSILCEGCFNPLTHSLEPNQLIEPEVLAKKIITQGSEIEGITISGGEPFDQSQALSLFLHSIRDSSNLSVILFSGHAIETISRMPESTGILKNTDVLISGPFDQSHAHPENLAGSSKKIFHFLTKKYSLKDFSTIPEAEIIIDSQGNITYSGLLFINH